jgi:hypothetical protein
VPLGHCDYWIAIRLPDDRYLRIPTIVTTRSDASRSRVPIDRDHVFRSIATGVTAPSGAFADLRV